MVNVAAIEIPLIERCDQRLLLDVSRYGVSRFVFVGDRLQFPTVLVAEFSRIPAERRIELRRFHVICVQLFGNGVVCASFSFVPLDSA